MIRKPGIEPGAYEWESEILPLDYFRDDFICSTKLMTYILVYVGNHIGESVRSLRISI